jgi:serine/threonine protein kinase
MIAFACPSCGKEIRVTDESIVLTVRCPHCKRPASVPLPADATRPADAAPNEAPRNAPARPAAEPAAEPETSPYDPSSEVSRLPGPDSPELVQLLGPPQGPDELGRLGHHRILRVLGAGGMGVVFHAEDTLLHRPVALKAMLPARAASPTNRERFLREARAAAAVEHDHVVAIYQIGEDHDIPFLTMPLLKGEPLSARLGRDKKLPARDVARVGRQAAEGLAAAHGRGLVHRDVKPANIWLEEGTGQVKILDFGLARAGSGEARLTQFGAFLGTPGYASPEQVSGKAVDGRSDLFSLGVLLYRTATGELPFKGTDMLSTLMAVMAADLVPPHRLERGVPPRLSELIVRLLARRPDDRLPSARAVADALAEIECASDTPARPPAPKGENHGGRTESARAVAGFDRPMPPRRMRTNSVPRSANSTPAEPRHRHLRAGSTEGERLENTLLLPLCTAVLWVLLTGLALLVKNSYFTAGLAVVVFVFVGVYSSFYHRGRTVLSTAAGVCGALLLVTGTVVLVVSISIQINPKWFRDPGHPLAGDTVALMLFAFFGAAVLAVLLYPRRARLQDELRRRHLRARSAEGWSPVLQAGLVMLVVASVVLLLGILKISGWVADSSDGVSAPRNVAPQPPTEGGRRLD